MFHPVFVGRQPELEVVIKQTIQTFDGRPLQGAEKQPASQHHLRELREREGGRLSFRKPTPNAKLNQSHLKCASSSSSSNQWNFEWKEKHVLNVHSLKTDHNVCLYFVYLSFYSPGSLNVTVSFWIMQPPACLPRPSLRNCCNFWTHKWMTTTILCPLLHSTHRYLLLWATFVITIKTATKWPSGQEEGENEQQQQLTEWCTWYNW